MLILDFILGEMKNITRLKILEFFYKSSDYSTTFTASRAARVTKERDNTVELVFGVFCAKIKPKLNRIQKTIR